MYVKTSKTQCDGNSPPLNIHISHNRKFPRLQISDGKLKEKYDFKNGREKRNFAKKKAEFKSTW